MQAVAFNRNTPRFNIFVSNLIEKDMMETKYNPEILSLNPVIERDLHIPDKIWKIEFSTSQNIQQNAS